jgi:predicted membrane protein
VRPSESQRIVSYKFVIYFLRAIKPFIITDKIACMQIKTGIVILAVTVFMLMASGCTTPPKQFTERRLVIASKETVSVNELNLSITNNGCGRQWEGNAERPYCGLVIKRKDSTIMAGNDFNPVYIGNIKIQLDKMNPWGREEDSVPPGGCRVIITRLSDISR